MKRYQAKLRNKSKTGIKILTRNYLNKKSIKYPKPLSISRNKSDQKNEVFKEFRFRNPLDGSITKKKINLKEYAKYSSSILQEDKLTVNELSRAISIKNKSKPSRSRDIRYSRYMKNYAAAKKVATAKYGRMSEKSRKSLTSFVVPARVLFKLMDYQEEKILSIVVEETLKLIPT